MTDPDPVSPVRPPAVDVPAAGTKPVDLRRPVAIRIGWMVSLVGLFLLAAIALSAMVFVFLDVRDKWPGLLIASGISLVAAVLSIPPLLVGARFGLMGAVAGFFAASFLRLVVSLGGCLLAVHATKIEPTPALLVMALCYFAILSGETIAVGSALFAYKPGTLNDTMR